MKIIERKKIKLKKNRRIFIFLTVIILVITSIHVNAGTQDSNLVKNFIDGYYAIVKLADGTHIYPLDIYKVNGKTAYCIEVGADISSTIYNSTNDLSLSNLSTNQIDYLKKIMYFGYDYKNHQDYKYYMAAQEMIWEYVSGVEVYWSNEESKTGASINIDKYKNEIISLIKSNDVLPSFANSSYNALLGQTISVIDSNSVLKDYEVTNNGTQNVTINDNQLNISTRNDRIGSYTIIFSKKSYYTNNATLYYNSSSQKLMSVGKIDMPKFNLKLELDGYALTFKLVDKETQIQQGQGQATLTGAIYDIYTETNTLIARVNMEEGKLNSIFKLSPQKYYIKQIKASPGYKLNDNIIEIFPTRETENITLEEEVIKSKIEILKIYGDKKSNEYQSESNIYFNIYDNLSNLYQTIITDNLGYTSIILPYGRYTIKQENTTPGYIKVEDMELNINENSSETVRYNLFDDAIKVKLNIITREAETNNRIVQENIKYKLKDIKNNKYVSYNDQDVFSTNDIGELLIPVDLLFGTYLLEQVSPPSNYLKNDELITVTIDENSKFLYNEESGLTLDIDYLNQVIKGIVHITTSQEKFVLKNNNYSYEIISRPNIKLELYAKKDIKTKDEIIHYKKGETIETLVTNELGKVDTTTLYLGEYCLKEVENIREDNCFTLEELNNETSIVQKNITLNIKEDKYNVILSNIDEETKNAIEGTIIELYTEKGKLINTSITNENGIIKIVNLKKGKYYFKQKNIKKNYQLNSSIMYFEVINKDLSLTITNRKQKSNNFLNIRIPNTLSNKNYLKEFVFISFIIIGMVFYAFKKKKDNSD